MSNFTFMWLFPEANDLVEYVTAELKEDASLSERISSVSNLEDADNLSHLLKQIRDDNPYKLKLALAKIITAYDMNLEATLKKLPLITGAYWQNYRRNQVKSSLSPFDFAKSAAENDEALAESYKLLVQMIPNLAEQEIIPLDVEPKIELLNLQTHDPFGMNVYTFKISTSKNGNEIGRTTETIWDFREPQVPKLMSAWLQK